LSGQQKQKGSKPPSTIDELLTKVGLSVITDQRLNARLKNQKDLYEVTKSAADIQQHKSIHNKYLRAKAEGRKTEDVLKQEITKEIITLTDGTDVSIEVIGPYGALRDMEQHLLQIEELLRNGSIPWGRAMENAWYARVMKAWERLLAKGGYEAILAAKRIIAHPKEGVINEWDIVEKVKGWLEVEVFPYAKMISDISWSKDDVLPGVLLTLHQPPTPATQSQFGAPYGSQFAASGMATSPQTQTGTFPVVMRADELREPTKGAEG